MSELASTLCSCCPLPLPNRGNARAAVSKMVPPDQQKNTSKDDDNRLVICHRYRFLHKIGSGTFGTVLLGIDLNNGNEIAMKLEAKAKNCDRLWSEYHIYKDLRNEIGFPEVIWLGSQGDFHILVMELLGPSLEDLFNFCNRRFSLKTVLFLADQLLSRLQMLHQLGFIHRDVKADNFVMGLNGKQHIVHLIDMGLAKKIIFGVEPKIHAPFSKGRSFCGTVRFASPNAHRGFELGRRDDLISLGYSLIYFLKGELPWCKYKILPKEKYTELTAHLKYSLTAEQLCDGCPAEFATFLKYCTGLSFEEAPDYGRMRQMFWVLFVKKQFVFDNIFDWDLYSIEYEIVEYVKVFIDVREICRKEQVANGEMLRTKAYVLCID